MDQESQKQFDAIRAMDPASITEAEAAFLRARASYLSTDEQVKFTAALTAAEAESAEETNKPAKTKPAK